MATEEHASKRIKSEPIKSEPQEDRPLPKFKVGDKVYKGGLPSAVKNTQFDVQTVSFNSDKAKWSYIISNDAFMGKNSKMVAPEEDLFTVQHPLNTSFSFTIEGTDSVTYSKGEITDWNFVDGNVVYDLTFKKKAIRRDAISRVVEVGTLGGVTAKSAHVKLEKDGVFREPILETEFELGTLQTTADKLGKPLGVGDQEASISPVPPVRKSSPVPLVRKSTTVSTQKKRIRHLSDVVSG